MDLQIALMLGLDGITNGAIYALLALAMVMVFAVTRVIFIPQGEFVTFGALTLASLQAGNVPGTLWMLLVMGGMVAAKDSIKAIRNGNQNKLPKILLTELLMPLCIAALLFSIKPATLPLPLQIALTLILIVPMGAMVYRLVYQPIAEAPTLLLLIISVALHFALVGLGLLFFGAEGTRTPPFSDGAISLGPLTIQFQTLWIVASSMALIIGLFLFFEKTIYGKALRATAMNRTGAHLMGISPNLAGRLTFTLAALIGAFSGVLISPITTIYFDSGFLIGLKGFVGAIIGGLASYPVAAAGALLVSLLESYSSFWASAYKEVLVFSLIIPVLMWRSLHVHHTETEE